jgi:hypothetical protein
VGRLGQPPDIIAVCTSDAQLPWFSSAQGCLRNLRHPHVLLSARWTTLSPRYTSSNRARSTAIQTHSPTSFASGAGVATIQASRRRQPFRHRNHKLRVMTKTRARVPAGSQWTSVMTRWRWRLRQLTTLTWAITRLPQGIMAARCCATKMQLKKSREMLPSMCGWGECSRD